MFPRITVTPYGVFQYLAILLFFCQMICYLACVVKATPSMDFRAAERRLARHAMLLTLLYVACNVLVAKIFFDLRRDAAGLDWRNYLNLEHYTGGGYWGWPIAFLPLSLLYPFVFRLDRVLTLRAIALSLPMVLILQKAACFCAGCCAGVPTDLPLGMVFPEDSQCATPGVPVHPVPLYDMGIAAAMYVVLLAMDRSAGARPFLFPAFVGLYGLNRLVTELFRPEFDGAFSLRQWLAGGVAAVCLVLLIAGRAPWRWLLGASATPKRRDTLDRLDVR